MQGYAARNLFKKPHSFHPSKVLPYEIVDDATAYYVVFISLPRDPAQVSCRMTEDPHKVEVFLKRNSSNELADRKIIKPCVFHFPKDADLRGLQVQSRGGTQVLVIPKIFKHLPESRFEKQHFARIS